MLCVKKLPQIYSIHSTDILLKKFTSNHIHTGSGWAKPNTVVITDAAGVIVDLVARAEAGDDVQILNGIICPGFINAHCHTELSHLKGKIEKGNGLMRFVQNVMQLRHDSDSIQEAIYSADTAMYNQGIVAVGDICNGTDSVEVKLNSKIMYHNFIEVAGVVSAAAEQRFLSAKKTLNDFVENGLTASTLAAHAPYSVSEPLFKLVNKATAHNLTTIHMQEAKAENDWFRHGKGGVMELYNTLGLQVDALEKQYGSSLQYALQMYDKQQQLLMVHNTYTEQTDIDFATEWCPEQVASLHYILCPAANLFIENTLPQVDLLLKSNLSIAIGTDSLASNDRLDMVAEMYLLQQSVSTEVLLNWATSGGASALQLNDRFGYLKKGTTPGLVLIENADHGRLTANSRSFKII